MMGRRGTASRPTGTAAPFRRMSRCSISRTPGPVKTVVSEVTAMGAAMAGAWKRTDVDPVAIQARSRAACRSAASRWRASTSSTVSARRATTSTSDEKRGASWEAEALAAASTVAAPMQERNARAMIIVAPLDKGRVAVDAAGESLGTKGRAYEELQGRDACDRNLDVGSARGAAGAGAGGGRCRPEGGRGAGWSASSAALRDGIDDQLRPPGV